MVVKYRVQGDDKIEVVIENDGGLWKSSAFYQRNGGESDTDFVARAVAGGSTLGTTVSGLEAEIISQGGTPI